MKEFFVKKRSNKEVHMILLLVGLIGCLIMVLTARGQEMAFGTGSNWYWAGLDLACAGFMGLLATDNDYSEYEDRN